MADIVDNTQERLESVYDEIESQMGGVIDKLCLMEQVEDLAEDMTTLQQKLADVEKLSRAVENYRLSSLARAVQIMLKELMATMPQSLPPSTYAYLIYSVKTIAHLTESSRYALRTGYEVPEETVYGEAISAIIDHTDELTLPHMRGN